MIKKKSKGRQKVHVGAGAGVGAVVRICGSVEPELKEIFTARQQFWLLRLFVLNKDKSPGFLEVLKSFTYNTVLEVADLSTYGQTEDLDVFGTSELNTVRHKCCNFIFLKTNIFFLLDIFNLLQRKTSFNAFSSEEMPATDSTDLTLIFWAYLNNANNNFWLFT